MPDAIRATIELKEAPAKNLTIRTSYNVAAMSFSPFDLIIERKKLILGFVVSYEPAWRQRIADSWPHSIDDSVASHDWNWKVKYNLSDMVGDMLFHLVKQKETPRPNGRLKSDIEQSFVCF